MPGLVAAKCGSYVTFIVTVMEVPISITTLVSRELNGISTAEVDYKG